jgi:hypothetical protein
MTRVSFMNFMVLLNSLITPYFAYSEFRALHGNLPWSPAPQAGLQGSLRFSICLNNIY